MGIEWNEQKREYVWHGGVRELVNTVGDGDARLGFVRDSASGARIAMNISDIADDDDEGEYGSFEPFYIESPDGENLDDAYNRREAVQMLMDWRKKAPKKRTTYTTLSKKSKKSRKSDPGLGTMR